MEIISSTMWDCSTCKITGWLDGNGKVAQVPAMVLWEHHLECEEVNV